MRNGCWIFSCSKEIIVNYFCLNKSQTPWPVLQHRIYSYLFYCIRHILLTSTLYFFWNNLFYFIFQIEETSLRQLLRLSYLWSHLKHQGNISSGSLIVFVLVCHCRLFNHLLLEFSVSCRCLELSISHLDTNGLKKNFLQSLIRE